MRVAIDATALGSGRGGDETYLTGLLHGLAEVAGGDDCFPLFVRPQAAASAAGTWPAGRFPTETIKRSDGAGRLLMDLPARVARHSRAALPPDLVHSITHHPLWGGVPHALMVTDLSFHHHPEFYTPATRARLRSLVPHQARRARVVMTLSEFCKQDLVTEYGIEPERVFIVPCTVDGAPAEVQPDGRAARLAELGITGQFFLYLGNLHPRKNVARLIAAFGRARRTGRLPGHQLVVAGARWWGGGVEEQEAAALPEGSVVFLGRVSNGVKDDLLRAALALAYPSIFEGFGLPPLEAMACGTPVIAGARAAVPEVLGDAAVMVDPYDTDCIAAALLEVAGNAVLRQALRSLGRERVARYSRERTGQAALAAFTWAMQSEPGRAPARRAS